MVVSRGDNLDWAVIGAASDDAGKYHAPDPYHVNALLDALQRTDTPVFFKGNMASLEGLTTPDVIIPWQDEFPKAAQS